MEIKNITSNFEFYEKDGDYVLELGFIGKGTDRKETLEIRNVIDPTKLSVEPTCGCTVAETRILDGSTVRTILDYQDCDKVFTKTVKIKYNNKLVQVIKIKGACQ